MIRPGLIVYGYYPDEKLKTVISLKPCAKLKSKITFIKTVQEGESISYNRTFITEKETIIATVPIGYADGIKRILSNKGFCLVNNQKARIVGNICMDSLMIDITNIKNVNLEDEVYLFDNNLITVEEIAEKCSTINHEILTNISKRVERKYINGVC